VKKERGTEKMGKKNGSRKGADVNSKHKDHSKVNREKTTNGKKTRGGELRKRVRKSMQQSQKRIWTDSPTLRCRPSQRTFRSAEQGKVKSKYHIKK